MSQNYRIYLDACCLNRPFDDQTQPRIALETQAIFLTTDDRLIKKAQNNIPLIQVKIDNPVQWLIKMTQIEDNTNA